MKPDNSLPGLRRVIYAVLAWANRHPRVWRALGALGRQFPVIAESRVSLVARSRAVQHVLRRDDSFQSTSHQPNLIAGDFIIGMPPGPRYRFDRQHFMAMMPPTEEVVQRSSHRARRLVATLAARQQGFDLVEDYLMGLVHHSVVGGLDAAGPTVVSGRKGETPDRERLRAYLLEIRHVAAQLFNGDLAPPSVRMRAQACALSLQSRVHNARHELRGGAHAARAVDRSSFARNGIGYAWVSHPVTVQAGALIVQELMRRPAEYAALRRRAHELGADVWSDAALRHSVKRHVVELMRFRPVFPVIGRDVPRDTHLDAGAGRCPIHKAGSSVVAVIISALFDPRRVSDNDAYSTTRHWAHEDEMLMMFGFGPHQCPGRWIAVEVLASALIGLLTLPRLDWANPWWQRRQRYDGPMIAQMRLVAEGP